MNVGKGGGGKSFFPPIVTETTCTVLYACAVRRSDIQKIKNALIKSVYRVPETTVVSLLRYRQVLRTVVL